MSTTYSQCPECGGMNRVPLENPKGKAPICGRCKSELPVKDGINELSASQLTKLLQKSPLPVVVDFWAPWCGPCVAFAPTYKEGAKRSAGKVVYVKVNTEAHPLAGSTYGVKGIPTLVVFRGGIERARQTGAMPLEPFLGWLERSTS